MRIQTVYIVCSNPGRALAWSRFGIAIPSRDYMNSSMTCNLCNLCNYYRRSVCFIGIRSFNASTVIKVRDWYMIWIWVVQGNDQVQVYKDCQNCLIFFLTVIGGRENIWFPDAQKRFISNLILPEKTWKRTKTFFFKT